MDELIARFNAAGVRFLVMGGQAIRLKGMPRLTLDWAFSIPPGDLPLPIEPGKKS